MNRSSKRFHGGLLASILLLSALGSAGRVQALATSEASKFDWKNAKIKDPCATDQVIQLRNGGANPAFDDGAETSVTFVQAAVGDLDSDGIDDAVVQWECVVANGTNVLRAYRFNGTGPIQMPELPPDSHEREVLSSLKINAGVITGTWESSGTRRWQWNGRSFVSLKGNANLPTPTVIRFKRGGVSASVNLRATKPKGAYFLQFKPGQKLTVGTQASSGAEIEFFDSSERPIDLAAPVVFDKKGFINYSVLAPRDGKITVVASDLQIGDSYTFVFTATKA